MCSPFTNMICIYPAMIIVSFYMQFKIILITVVMYKVNDSDLHCEMSVHRT
jgi:hypothetical protein